MPFGAGPPSGGAGAVYGGAAGRVAVGLGVVGWTVGAGECVALGFGATLVVGVGVAEAGAESDRDPPRPSTAAAGGGSQCSCEQMVEPSRSS